MQTLRWLTSKCKIGTRKKTHSLSPLNTYQSRSKHIVHDLFNVCSPNTTNKHFLQWKRIWTHFAFYDSDTPVTLKQVQSNQTGYELVDPKQGYNHAKLERPPIDTQSILCMTLSYATIIHVNWCFESSQPQRIITELKTNFHLSPSYSAQKSWNFNLLKHFSEILLHHTFLFKEYTTPLKHFT